MEKQNIEIIKTRIWETCNLIRSLGFAEAQTQQVIIAFTFLRRIDCLISKYAEESSLFYSKNRERMSDERLDKELRIVSGGYPFFNYSGYTFGNILLANNSIEVVLNSYIQGFSKNVQEILDGMNYRQNVAVLQRKSRFLVELIDSFSKIDLSASSINNEEFIELISSLLSKGVRVFNTSLELSNLICKCLLSKDFRDDKDDLATIYDPVCGTGVLLAYAGEIAKSSANQQPNVALYGQEIEPYPCAIGKALTLFTGNDDSKIVYGDTLTDDLFPKEHFQYILADMPLGLQWRSIKDRIERESFDINGRFNIGLPTTQDSQFLFIQHIISKMEPNGSRAAFITSGSILWGGDVKSGESRIRRWMFEQDLVETIIALPDGLLPYSKIPIYLWILNNRKENLRVGRVQLINGISKSIVDRKDSVLKNILNNYKHPIDDGMSSRMVNNDVFGFYELKLLETGSPTRTVTIDLNTNIDNYIKEKVAPLAKGEISVDYKSVEKGYSVNFEKFFKMVVSNDNDYLNIDDLSKKILSLVEEFRSFETDLILSSNLDMDIVKEETIQYGVKPKKVWPSYPLHFFADILKGQSQQPDGELPYLTVSSLRNSNVKSGFHIMKPSENNKIVTDSDILIINTGANAGEIFKGVFGIPSSTLSIIRADENVVLPKYLYYLLKGNEKYLRILPKGVSIKYIDTRTLSNVCFQLPSLEEQIQIVTKLDKAIEKIDRIIDLLGGTDNTLTQYRQALIENVMQGEIKI